MSGPGERGRGKRDLMDANLQQDMKEEIDERSSSANDLEAKYYVREGLLGLAAPTISELQAVINKWRKEHGYPQVRMNQVYQLPLHCVN